MPEDAGAAEPRWIEAWTRQDGDRRARDVFESSFNASPDLVCSAPGRVTIMGEYTDVSGGLSLPTVIPHRAYVAVRKRTDDHVRIVYEGPAGVDDASERWEGTLARLDGARVLSRHGYAAGVLWALQERGFSGDGLDIAITSCVPRAAGVSSLVSISGAVALAVNRAWGLGLPEGAGAHELADACVDVENDFAGAATAGLSQHTILRCPEGEALLLDFSQRPPAATPCPLYFPEYGLAMLVVHAGPQGMSQPQMVRSRMEEADAAARELGVASLRELHDMPDGRDRIEALHNEVLRRRARHTFTENERVELVRDELAGTAPAHERFVAVGKAMFRSHASLDGDLDVSCEALNLAVETAFRSGALGAHMVGAGVDSSAVALIRKASAGSTARAIDQALSAAGLPRPAFLMV